MSLPAEFGGSWYLTGLIGLIGLGVGLVLGAFVFRNRSQQTKSRQNTRRDHDKAGIAERERLRKIYTLISTLTSTLVYKKVLDAALDLAASEVTTPNGDPAQLFSAVLLFTNMDQGGTKLTVGSARRFTPSDMRLVFPGRAGLIGQVIESGEGVRTDKIPDDPELGRVVALRACKTAYGLPLRAGLDTYGILIFAHPEPNFFSPTYCDALDIISHQAAISIQNATLYQNLAQEKERMVMIQEEARKKLARDLHDGPTQSVAAIAMRVNFVRRLMERDSAAAAEELYKIEDLARRTTKEIRHMLFTLRPLVLESQGLIAALEAMAEKQKETYEQNVIIQAEPSIIPLIEMGKQTIIFYIAEEAVNNARKYAQAAHIWVRLKSVESEMALLEIQDDGVGFNVGAVDASYDQRGSLGMVNMRERTELVNGLFRIDSVEGKGTIIQVLIPLSEDAADRLRRGA